jgi:hypothetical protein
MKRAFGSAVVGLLFAFFAFGTPAPKGPAEMDLEFHKKVPASGLKIDLSSTATVTRTKQGLVLALKVTNASASEIKTTLAHEWHGGEWPLTALYASATPVKDKDSKLFSPVYLVGEDQDAPRAVTLSAGKTIDLELRMDWPGTGSQIAIPLIQAPGKYVIRFVLVFEVSGRQQYIATAPKIVELLAK